MLVSLIFQSDRSIAPSSYLPIPIRQLHHIQHSTLCIFTSFNPLPLVTVDDQKKMNKRPLAASGLPAKPAAASLHAMPGPGPAPPLPTGPAPGAGAYGYGGGAAWQQPQQQAPQQQQAQPQQQQQGQGQVAAVDPAAHAAAWAAYYAVSVDQVI